MSIFSNRFFFRFPNFPGKPSKYSVNAPECNSGLSNPQEFGCVLFIIGSGTATWVTTADVATVVATATTATCEALDVVATVAPNVVATAELEAAAPLAAPAVAAPVVTPVAADVPAVVAAFVAIT